MKLEHHRADHRPTLIRFIKLYTKDDKGQRTVLALQHFPQPLLIPPHAEWGVEVEYEPIETGMDAELGRRESPARR